ncbi:MAG: ABC transporter substrate-binding protein [Hyphomicrobiaceae bacterium]|nr:ABC transporter substrate-binding protein [Hyphomicrobiaceae bacterium]
MTRKSTLAVAVAAVLAAGTVAPALAQKSGGTLRIQHRDNPSSLSIHEESTVSVQIAAMPVFNNLVIFDQQKPLQSMDTIVPDLAESWAWDDSKTKLTFKLRQGVKWHDGKPFTSADVKCTFDLLLGKAKDRLRKNPRAIWYREVQDVTVNGDHEATLVLKKPQPSILMMLATGYSPMYPCHVSTRDMRQKLIGTGPFKFVEFKGNDAITLVKNPDYFKKGKPYVDRIEFKIMPSRSTRMLSFVAKEFDMTFSSDVTIPLLKDVKAQAPDTVCDLHPQYVSRNLIVNAKAPPFDNPKIRKAMALAIDRQAFIDILTEGKGTKGGAMLPAPEGQWGMPKDVLEKLTGYGPDVAKNQEEAKKIMTELGYSADKPLKVKVSTRDIAIYRDPAVILIDQLKKIFIDGELEVVDTSQWHAKVARRDYAVGMNLTGVGADDPDINFIENYTCKSERNYTQYCNPEVEKLIDAQSAETDVEKRKKLVWQIEGLINEDVARPIIYHDRAAHCRHPYVKGFVTHMNSIYSNWRLEDVWLDK